MKSRKQIVAKVRRLRKALTLAEELYVESVGCRDEEEAREQVVKLDTQIEVLEWVLERPR